MWQPLPPELERPQRVQALLEIAQVIFAMTTGGILCFCWLLSSPIYSMLVAVPLILDTIANLYHPFGKAANAELKKLQKPEVAPQFLATYQVSQGAICTGKDRCLISVDEDRLVFSGLRASFKVARSEVISKETGISTNLKLSGFPNPTSILLTPGKRIDDWRNSSFDAFVENFMATEPVTPPLHEVPLAYLPEPYAPLKRGVGLVCAWMFVFISAAFAFRFYVVPPEEHWLRLVAIWMPAVFAGVMAFLVIFSRLHRKRETDFIDTLPAA